MECQGELAILMAQVLSPPILFFALGVFAALVKSDLEIPEAMSSAMIVFLLCSIGLEGGVGTAEGIAEIGIRGVMVPALAAAALGVSIVLLAHIILRKLKLDIANAGAIAGHYGAISIAAVIVTFAFLDRHQVPFEGYILAVYPFMAHSAIISAIVLTHFLLAKRHSLERRGNIRQILRLGLLNRAVILLIPTMIIGWVAGPTRTELVMPFFREMFTGVLCLFLLDMGLVAAKRLSEWRVAGPRLAVYALLMPLIHGIIGVFVGTLIGLSVGGATLFGVMTGSASFIEAPAAMRVAIPEANPALSLTASLALTFPLTVVIGIPLYYRLAQALA